MMAAKSPLAAGSVIHRVPASRIGRRGAALQGGPVLIRFLAFAAAALALISVVTPATAQLLGLEHYLSPPKVEYSATITMVGDDQKMEGKINHALDKERRELSVEGDTEVMIIRLDRKLVWSLSPEEKLYLESSLDEALGRVPGPDGKIREPQLKLTPLGDETIEGLPATKQSVSGKDVDGTPIEGTLWISAQGIVLRAETQMTDEDGKKHMVRMQLHNVRIAPQDQKLFEIPAGYKRVTPSRLGRREGVVIVAAL